MSNIETMMRQKYPSIRWCQGREMEGNGVSFGPTVQMSAKYNRAKREQTQQP